MSFGQTGENRLDPVCPIGKLYLTGVDATGSRLTSGLVPLGVRLFLDALDRSPG